MAVKKHSTSIVFMNGSKQHERIAAGLCGPKSEYSDSMRKSLSSFLAEIHAIKRCAQLAQLRQRLSQTGYCNSVRYSSRHNIAELIHIQLSNDMRLLKLNELGSLIHRMN